MKSIFTDPNDILPQIDVDALTDLDVQAKAMLAGLTGPDPDRFPSLFPMARNRYPGRDMYDSLAPLEAAAFDFFQELQDQGKLNTFFRDLGGVFTAAILARRLGVAFNVTGDQPDQIKDDDFAQYFTGLLRVGLIGVSDPAYRASLVDIGIHAIGRIISVLGGDTPALNDFIFQQRLSRRTQWWLDAFPRKKAEPCEVPISYFVRFDTKDFKWHEFVDKLHDRIVVMCPEPGTRKLAAWQVCKWIHAVDGYPYRDTAWFAATQPVIWNAFQNYIEALDRQTATSSVLEPMDKSNWLTHAIKTIQSLIEIIGQRGVATPAQMALINRFFQESRHGRRRTWTFDMGHLKRVIRTVNQRYSRLAQCPEGTEALREEWGGCVGSPVPLESSSPVDLPYDRFLNAVIERHDDLDYIENGIMTQLCYQLTERFDLVSVEMKNPTAAWNNFGTASATFCDNLRRALRYTIDPDEHALVVDIAIDYLARLHDKVWILSGLTSESDRLLLEQMIQAELRVIDSKGVNSKSAEGQAGIARKKWILKAYPDDSPQWWADLEDRLVADLNGLDDNPWVVQKAVRMTANTILHTEEYEYHFTEWTGFSPPEIFRQAWLTLRTADKNLRCSAKLGSSALILTLAPHLARLNNILNRPGVMDEEQAMLVRFIPTILQYGPSAIGANGFGGNFIRFQTRWQRRER